MNVCMMKSTLVVLYKWLHVLHPLIISYVAAPTHLPGLMGLFEKRRFRDFMVAANDFNQEDPKTYKGELLALELRYFWC